MAALRDRDQLAQGWNDPSLPDAAVFDRRPLRSADWLFLHPAGQPRCYYASDNLERDHYQGLTSSDLVDIAALNGLHFNGACQEGVVFHLIGALSEFGKLGVLGIGRSHQRAEALYHHAIHVSTRKLSRRVQASQRAAGVLPSRPPDWPKEPAETADRSSSASDGSSMTTPGTGVYDSAKLATNVEHYAVSCVQAPRGPAKHAAFDETLERLR
jgi:hypothetical protein